MKEASITKEFFFDGTPDAGVKVRIMDYIHSDSKRRNRIWFMKKHRFAFVWSTLSLVWVIFGWYFLYQSINPSLDKQITQTQSAITELIAMNDAEIL